MESKAILQALEKKLRITPDSKQKTIDKDIFNTLVTMERRISALENREEIKNVYNSCCREEDE